MSIELELIDGNVFKHLLIEKLEKFGATCFPTVFSLQEETVRKRLILVANFVGICHLDV